MPRVELESWLGLMQEVESLRVPPLFGRAHADVTLPEGGALATKTVVDGMNRAAASTVVVRSGRHFVRITVLAGEGMFYGVIRPGWDVEGGANAYDVDGHCFYQTCQGTRFPGQINWAGIRARRTYAGLRFPGTHEWQGMQPVREQGDCIGMLLDLDQGSMTVWKNDVRLRVMQVVRCRRPLLPPHVRRRSCPWWR